LKNRIVYILLNLTVRSFGVTVFCPLSAETRTYIFKASKSGISTIFVIPYEIVTLMNANNLEFKSTELTEETIRIFY